MNISLEEAISLHKCISQIEGASISNGDEYDAFDEDIVVTYHKKDACCWIIDGVRFGTVESYKAKNLLQEYFDEVYNIL